MFSWPTLDRFYTFLFATKRAALELLIDLCYAINMLLHKKAANQKLCLIVCPTLGIFYNSWVNTNFCILDNNRLLFYNILRQMTHIVIFNVQRFEKI